MKFMKLGSKPDAIQVLGNIRSLASDIASDFTVLIDGVTFHLHKFPLLSKSSRLQRLAAEALDLHSSEVELLDLPGGVDTFELCVKFCYGMTITLNAFNVVAVRCAAEHLEMTEIADKGNLIFKVDVFLNSCIYRGWKDSIIALQSTKALLPLAEDLKVASRCIDSIASKSLANPSKVDWSFTYTRAGAARDHGGSEIVHSPPWNGIQSKKFQSVPDDWWIEDLAELEIDLYWRVLVAVKSTGRMPHKIIGEALHFYSFKWLPGVSKYHSAADSMKGNSQALTNDYVELASKHRQLLEKIVSLLPPEKGSTSCSFLLKLLRAATILGASTPSKMELARRVGLQLDEASLNDLLIPSLSYANDTLYDVDLVQSIVEHFMMQDQSPPTSPTRVQHSFEKRRTRSAENIDFVESRRSTSTTHSSKLRVGKLIDSYLAEIARDAHLAISKFMALAESIPGFARPVHDGLYRAIDIYLKEHPGFSKTEKKRICRLLDCKKLSMEACMHAAQNERLPLRVVVQVLFFEQVRAAMTGGLLLNELPSNVRALMASQEGDSREGTSSALEDRWEAVQQNLKTLKGDMASIKVDISAAEKGSSAVEPDDAKSPDTAKSKRFLCKLWPGKSCSDGTKSCCP